MPLEALTSAEISLPPKPDALRVRERIAALADSVDLVALTDNHAGEARMSPLAAVALAREQGVRTVVHISCRDRNRLALQSQVVGAAALGAEEHRIAVRDVRRDALKHLQELVKNGDVGDDDERAAETRVQKLTDEHTSKIDDLLKRKEAEIMEV